MKTPLTVARIFLKSAWRAVCRHFSDQLRRLFAFGYLRCAAVPQRSGSLCSALTALLLAPLTVLHGAEPPLKVGDPAPVIRVGEWVAGHPVGIMEPGRVYILEFWATWCAPCIAAMPHLAEVQAKHEKAGLTVIAVAVKDETKAVKDFVAKRKADWNLAVAIDVVEGEHSAFMARNWLERAGHEGLPWTFLVDRQGKIAWIGHPMRVDGPLAAVLAGTFDPAGQQQVDKAFAELNVKLGEALRESCWQDVLSVLDELSRVDPASAPLNHSTRIKALFRVGDPEAAIRFAQDAAHNGSPIHAAQIASELLKAPEKRQIDYDLVVRLSEQAIKNGASRNPVALSALARAYEGQGKVEDAVRVWQQMLELDDPSIDQTGVRKRIETHFPGATEGKGKEKEVPKAETK